jgi:four helix bundle protein
MSQAVANKGLAVYDLAVEAAGLAIKLATKVPAPLKPVADQLIRAASSVPANLAEGHSRSGRGRAHLWRIAYGSAKEVDSHLRLLAAARAVNGAKAEEALMAFDSVRAMTWRLLHPADTRR